MRGRSKRAVAALVIGLFVIGVFQTPVLAVARGWVWDWLVRGVGQVVGYQEIDVNNATRESSLLAENIRLKAELQDYARLRQQLGTPSFVDFRAVPVAFVGRPLDTFQSKFLLSRGAHDGLVLGAPIVVRGSALLGFVVELSDATAIGQLVVAPDTALAAQVVSDGEGDTEQPKANGLVRGQYYTSLLLTTVPRDIPLQADQAVVTEAKTGVLPFGLLLGTIQSIQSSENDVYQEAALRLPYDVYGLGAGVVLLPR